MGTSQSKPSPHPRSTTFSNPEGPQVPSRLTRTYSEGGILHVDNLTLFGTNNLTSPIREGNVTQREGLGLQGASGGGLGDAEGVVEEEQGKDGKAGDVEVEEQDEERNARGVVEEGQNKMEWGRAR
ncbi:uncharacterized protein LOC134787584 [Penaeus indicus]|uniref:uncharacterized protein LOC134787584 n=1 Tax=Penaeus indicus TaxID=29960 RepID=UPI00300CCAC8